MEKRKEFFGKKGRLETNPVKQYYYQIEFESQDEVYDFYDQVRELCYEKNFGLDPVNWAAYSCFTYEGEKYIINSPRQSNGDNNWYNYENESTRYCEIYLVED